jgi:hypothetical protein
LDLLLYIIGGIVIVFLCNWLPEKIGNRYGELHLTLHPDTLLDIIKKCGIELTERELKGFFDEGINRRVMLRIINGGIWTYASSNTAVISNCPELLFKCNSNGNIDVSLIQSVNQSTKLLELPAKILIATMEEGDKPVGILKRTRDRYVDSIKALKAELDRNKGFLRVDYDDDLDRPIYFGFMYVRYVPLLKYIPV